MMQIHLMGHYYGQSQGDSFCLKSLGVRHTEIADFAGLLANLIEKYASELDIENLQLSSLVLVEQDGNVIDNKDSDPKYEVVTGKIAA